MDVRKGEAQMQRPYSFCHVRAFALQKVKAIDREAFG